LKDMSLRTDRLDEFPVGSTNRFGRRLREQWNTKTVSWVQIVSE